MKRVRAWLVAGAVGLGCGTGAPAGPGATGAGRGVDGGRDATPHADARAYASVANDGSPQALDGFADHGVGAADPRDDAGPQGPSLVALTVTSTADAAPPLELVPSFSPTVFDYALRCVAGPNPVTVSMTASLGAEGALLQPAASPSLPAETLSLTLSEGEAIVAVATEGGASVEYWVRCLPADFPALQWIPHAEAGTPTPGYYLLGSMIFPPSTGPYAMVLDAHGVPVWYASHVNPVYDVDSVVDAAISYASPFQIDELSPPATAHVTIDGGPPDVHELRALPDGNYLVFSEVPVSGVNLTGLSVPLEDGGVMAFGPDSLVVSCNILEVDPAGVVLWEWVATDHFDPVLDTTYLVPGDVGNDGSLDAFHCNSIDIDPANGNLLVSARHMDSVFYVERPSGRVVWKMGGAAYTKDGAPYVAVPDPFFRQHDARLLPGWAATCAGGSGQISLFDDETGEPGPARAVVYDVNVPGDGSGECGAFDGGASEDGGAPDGGSATVAWQYAGQGASAGVGSFRILADGSRTIGWGEVAMGGLVLSDVDEQGRDLLDVVSPDGMVSYRAVKVPLAGFSLSALRGAVGQ